METKDFSVTSKTQLAKLLANENLTIQHQKLHTAKFDPVNRVLYCPVWNNMTGSLYDLLLGHEVGHALYTPADGWHDAVCNKGRNYKHFLNVVEDARIEKKVKKRYPGIRRSFIDGYGNLMGRDFFGISGKDVNALPFIDRLNLFTKSSYTMDIQFTDFEQTLIEKVKNMETWSDVLAVTDEIWDYSKDEQMEMVNDNIMMDVEFGDEGDADDYEDSEFDEDTSEDGDMPSKSSGQSDDESDSDENGSGEFGESNGDSDEDEDDENPTGINRHKESQISKSGQYTPKGFEPTCETDIVYREKEMSLIDEKSRPFIYVEPPEPILENIVTPSARVQQQLTDYYKEFRSEEYRNNLLNGFKRKNERFISLLVKEFEMKKAADRFSKSKVSTTGDLDISKLYKYKVDDTIFRKAMHVPKGKSHGLILLLDKSGSMSENLKGSIEQILILASFCRKVNIPFSVYGFGNSEEGFINDKNKSAHSVEFFDKGANTIDFRPVMLREYLNSKMSNSEFSNACKNMLCLGNAYSRYGGSYGTFPNSEDLSNTPLCESIVACAKITKNFQSENGVDIVNLVILNDGDSDYTGTYRSADGYSRHTDTKRNNVILQDKKIKFQYHIREYEDLQTSIMKWYTAKTGAKVFGFFMSNNGHRGVKDCIRRQYFIDGQSIIDSCKGDMNAYTDKINQVYALIKKDKFVDCAKPGYETFFLIPGGNDLVVEDEEIEIDTTKKITAAKLTSAFRKFNEKRQLNRVLVNRFIEGIAK
jgi:hypothetical protein